MVAKTLASVPIPTLEHRFIHTSDFLESTRLNKAVRFVMSLRDLRRSILDGRAQGRVVIAHIHASSGASLVRKLIVSAVTRIYGVPYVVQLHSGHLLEPSGPASSLSRFLLRRLASGAARCVVPLAYWRDRARDILPATNRRGVEVVPNPVRLLARNAGRSPVSSPVRSFGYYGSMIASKGVLDLIDAFALALATEPTLTLHLAGVGRPRDESGVRERIGSRRVAQQVTVNGWLDDEGLVEFLSGIDAFVLFSQSEWFGLSAVEALNAGKVVVVSDLGSLREVLGENRRVRYVPLRSGVQGLAAALLEVSRNPWPGDDSGQEVQVQNSLPYSAEAVAERFASIYQDVASA